MHDDPRARSTSTPERAATSSTAAGARPHHQRPDRGAADPFIRRRRYQRLGAWHLGVLRQRQHLLPWRSSGFARDPLEGSFIQLADQSFDPDPGDTIVGRQWTIDGDTTNAQNPFAILPNEGTYVVSLTVTSSDGTSTTVTSGSTARDGTAIAPLVVSNAAPLAGALNVETLAGQDAPLLARFADSGWEDTHTGTWNIAGVTGGSLSEDNLPALSTGMAAATVQVSADATGSFTVRDNGGGSASGNFKVSVVADDPQRFEPNEAIANAPQLAAGGSYLRTSSPRAMSMCTKSCCRATNPCRRAARCCSG